MNEENFEKLFDPRGVAILGVNEKIYGGGYFLRVLMDIGFEKPLYLFNPRLKGKYLRGHLVRGSIKEIPDEDQIDYAIIAIPAEKCHIILEDLGKKGVKYVTIFSSGFSEVGRTDLEDNLIRIARKYNIRLLGPNCLGVYNPKTKMGLSRHHTTDPGNLGLISQSGDLGLNLSNMAIHNYGTNISKLVSLGNQVDLNALDFLEYFIEDNQTEIIGIYLENIKRKEDGRKFLKIAKKASEKKKPVILMKMGHGMASKEAILSHTGGLAGEDYIWDSLSEQTGIIRVKSSEELVSLAMAFNYISFETININLGIVSIGGGSSIETSEQLESHNLKIPKLKEKTMNRLQNFLSTVNTIFRNPLDLGGDGMNPEIFSRAMVEISKDPKISAVVFIKTYYFEQKFTEDILKAKRESKKPLVCVAPKIRDDLEEFRARRLFKKQMFAHGIPVFESIDLMAKTLQRMIKFKKFIERK